MKASYILCYVISVLLCIQNANGQDDYLKEIRKKYTLSVEDEDLAERLIEELAPKAGRPVLLGYKGATQVVMAKHLAFPSNKMKTLKTGMKTLQEAISKEPDNLEIRFLRFAIEDNLPNFLGYSVHLQDDKKTIIRNLPHAAQYGVDKAYKSEIIRYLLKSGECTAEEQKQLKTIVS